MSENETVKSVLGEYLYAKRYYWDMLNDLNVIVNSRKFLYESKFDNYTKIDLSSFQNRIIPSIKKAAHKYRMYIICGVRYVSLAYIDISEDIFEKILSDIKEELSQYDPMPTHDLDIHLISTVYIFKHQKIIYSENIYPSHMAWLLNSLKEENLIDDSLKECWKNTFE